MNTLDEGTWRCLDSKLHVFRSVTAAALSFLMIAGCAMNEATQSANSTSSFPRSTTVNVLCQHEDFSSAKQVCFKEAVARVVGQTLLTETQVLNGDVARSEILSYSAGYIDQYEIIDQRKIGNVTEYLLAITVSSSLIQDRILGKFKHTSELSGYKSAIRYQSYLDERRAADALLRAVLTDYPKRAIEPKILKQEQLVDKHRASFLRVTYSTNWSQAYLASLNEAFSKTSDRKSNSTPQFRWTVYSNKSGGFIGENNQYYFTDNTHGLLIAKTFFHNVALDATLLDAERNIVTEACTKLTRYPEPTTSWLLAQRDGTVDGNQIDEGFIDIRVSNNANSMSQLARVRSVELSVRRGDCQHRNQI